MGGLLTALHWRLQQRAYIDPCPTLYNGTGGGLPRACPKSSQRDYSAVFHRTIAVLSRCGLMSAHSPKYTFGIESLLEASGEMILSGGRMSLAETVCALAQMLTSDFDFLLIHDQRDWRPFSNLKLHFGKFFDHSYRKLKTISEIRSMVIGETISETIQRFLHSHFTD